MPRIFKYNDQTYEDPGEEFTNEDVRRHLTTYFPELAQATIEEQELEDGTVQVTFVKRAGTKGLTPLQIVERLDTVGPLHLDAVELLVELEGGDVEPARLTALQPQIQQAMRELEKHERNVKGIVRRCTQLQPTSKQTPAGF